MSSGEAHDLQTGRTNYDVYALWAKYKISYPILYNKVPDNIHQIVAYVLSEK